MATTYLHLRAPDGTAVAVKRGFCWPAFLFGGLWPLYRREWMLGFAMGIPFAALVIVDEVFVTGHRSPLRSLLILVAYIGYMVLCGVRGNAWLQSALRRRGYSDFERGIAV